MSSEAPTLPTDVVSAQEPVVPQPTGARTHRRRRVFRQILQLTAVIMVGFASYFLFSRFVVCSVQVQGVSMVPTLRDSQRYLLNRWIFHVRSPRVSEVVVLRDPLDNGLSVKRVVAAPGDSVLVQNGAIYVNGRELHERYLPRMTKTYPAPQLKEQLLVCGEHEYVVLGDNRNNSVDSRTYGPVASDRILGLLVR